MSTTMRANRSVVDLEVRGTLRAASDLVLAAQAVGFLDHAVDAGLGRRGQIEVDLAAGPQCGAVRPSVRGSWP